MNEKGLKELYKALVHKHLEKNRPVAALCIYTKPVIKVHPVRRTLSLDNFFIIFTSTGKYSFFYYYEQMNLDTIYARAFRLLLNDGFDKLYQDTGFVSILPAVIIENGTI